MIVRQKASISVLEAAYSRIRNAFQNDLPVYLSFSGGKDSIVIGHIIECLIQRGDINPKLLHVLFVDEEAIFDSVDQIVRDWRLRFIGYGAAFYWFCIEVKHFNCFNQLVQDESFICWDRYARDVWVRQLPEFAICSHPLLRPRLDTYQAFLHRVSADGIDMIGIRAYESVQRLQNTGRTNKNNPRISSGKKIFPLLDWRDRDVWLYLYENDLAIPDAYMLLWQVGGSRKDLRLSQFFSVDTAKNLVRLAEYAPDLFARILRREPNAYLAAMYWDSEMFRRSTAARRRLEDTTKRDYKAEVFDILSHINTITNASQLKTAQNVRGAVLRYGFAFTVREWKRAYEILIAGDPKNRSIRALSLDARMNLYKQ